MHPLAPAVEAGQLAGVTSISVLLEVLHRLMMLEAVRSRAVRPPKVLEKLRKRPEVVRSLSAYSIHMARIPEMGISIHSLPEEVLAASQRVRREHGLLVGDSLLLAVMRAEGLRTLATHDADLRRIEEIAVAMPADVWAGASRRALAVRVLVTGGAGFIGSHVAEAPLAAGHEVLVLDDLSAGDAANVPAGARFVQVDLCDRAAVLESVKAFRPEAVNHHAAQTNLRFSVENPIADARANVLGTLHVLEVALAHGARRFLYASSGGAIYGEPPRLPADEETPIHPLAPYGFHKFLGEEVLRVVGGQGRLPTCALRYGNVYGPRQNPKGEAGVVAIFATLLLRGERPTIFGDGSKTRDYVFVEDVVRANLLAMEKAPPGACYNIGTGQPTTDQRIFDLVRAAVGADLAPVYGSKRPGEVDHIYLNCRRAERDLGWRPTISLDEGIKRTVVFYRAKAGCSPSGNAGSGKTPETEE